MNVFVFQITLWESFGKLLVWRSEQSTVKALLTRLIVEFRGGSTLKKLLI